MACRVAIKAGRSDSIPNHKAHIKGQLNEGVPIPPTHAKRIMQLEQRITILGSIIDRWAPFMEIVERKENRRKSIETSAVREK